MAYKQNILPNLYKDEKRVTYKHNLYDLIGHELRNVISSGRVNEKNLDNILDKFSMDMNINLSPKYSIGLGYNTRIGRQPVDYRFSLSRRF
jgi:hypothetical protein